MAMVYDLRSTEEVGGLQSEGALTDPTQELSWNEKQIPFSLEDFLAKGERYFCDSKCLRAVAVGEGNALKNASGRWDKRY